MFVRLLWESFRRQKRRKALAAVAILLGTTAVSAMLALATTIGDRIHRELAVYGANIIVTPKAAGLAVKIGDVSIAPASADAVLHERDLDKLHSIFWANNITGISPEWHVAGRMVATPEMRESRAVWYPQQDGDSRGASVSWVSLWFNHPFGALRTGAPAMHPWWKIEGRFPAENSGRSIGNSDEEEVAVGSQLAQQFGLHLGDAIVLRVEHVGHIVGIVHSGDEAEKQIMTSLDAEERMVPPVLPGLPAGSATFSPAIDRVDISARTRPEDAFARQDPDTLSPSKREIWYCRPYANSIAYQIREAIPGADARQVRAVEQTEGTLLTRISGLMWLVSAAALLAAGFAVSAAMASAVLERQGEIGLMRSLGAGRSTIAAFFYTETGLLAAAAGAGGFVLGSLLAAWLGARIFNSSTALTLNWVLLPVILGVAVAVALLGATPAIRRALAADPSQVLRGAA